MSGFSTGTTRKFSGTWPGGGVLVTVDATIQSPRVIARALTDLARKRFVADRIFSRGSADQVAGGAALFQRSESIYMDRDPEPVGIGARFPRASWSELLFAAVVKKYGLEFPVYDESIRRNQIDVIQRGQRKIANSLVKFVDSVAMALFYADANVLTAAASGDWSTAATDIIFDIATARALIDNQDEGYEADTLLVHGNQELDLIVDKDIRDALPREGGGSSAVISGSPVPILGLRQIIKSNQVTAGKPILLSSGIVGTIADEAPLARESYVAYNPGAGQANIWVKVYNNDDIDATIVRGARFPAMWIAEPKAAFVWTGA